MPFLRRRTYDERVAAEVAKATGGVPLKGELIRHATSYQNGTAAGTSAETPWDIREALQESGMTADTPFSPGSPISPYAPFGQDPRNYGFQTGQNISARPRSGRVSFETLKSITDSYDIARICIQHRIDDVRSLGYRISAKRGITSNQDSQIMQAHAAVAKPDGYTPFDSWIAQFLECVLRYDAGAIYRRRNMRGDVIGLEVVDGTTVAPMIDDYGRVPEPPAPAFVQFANGVPWVWLNRDDLIYLPFRPQADSVYGLPPMEFMLLTANTDIRFQWHFLQYFTEGTVPAGFMEAPPDMSSPDQIQEWQDFFDAIMLGDQSKKRQIRWVPAGSQYKVIRDSKFDPSFVLHLMRKTCAAFSVTPNDLGFTEDVNRSTGETQVDVQFRIGTMPLTRFVEGIIDRYLQEDLHLDVEFRFDVGQEKEDRLKEAQAWQVYIETGIASPDEARDRLLGLPIDPSHPVPRGIITERAGFIPFKSIMELAGVIDANTLVPDEADIEHIDTVAGKFTPPAGVVSGPGDSGTMNLDGSTEVDPKVQAGIDAQAKAEAKGQQPQVTEAKPGQNAASTAAKRETAKAVALDPSVVRKWRTNARTRVAKGQKPRRFSDVAGGHADLIWSALDGATTREAVDAAFVLEPPPFPAAKARQLPDTEHGPEGDRLLGIYVPQVYAAMRSVLPGVAATVSEMLDQHSVMVEPTGDDEGSRAALIAAAVSALLLRVQMDTAPLSDVLGQLYVDSYLAGASVAAGLTGGIAALGPAAGVVASRAAAAAAGIVRTQMERIAAALANGLARGDSATSIIAAVEAIVDDEAKAEMITVTEMAEAMSQASLETYRQHGVEQVEWLAEGDACPVCLENMAASPISIDDVFPSGADAPPEHPNCRCAIAPVIDLPDV